MMDDDVDGKSDEGGEGSDRVLERGKKKEGWQEERRGAKRKKGE